MTYAATALLDLFPLAEFAANRDAPKFGALFAINLVVAVVEENGDAIIAIFVLGDEAARTRTIKPIAGGIGQQRELKRGKNFIKLFYGHFIGFHTFLLTL